MRVLLLFVSFLLSTQSLSVELVVLPNDNHQLERHLLKFTNNDLKQSALLVIGSPNKLASHTLIVMAHGFHPNPPQYGKVAGGESFRPGDYYRDWVNAYAKSGFNVLVPDYRGHNDSEGVTFTHQYGKVDFPEGYYASDFISAVDALQKCIPTKIKNIVIVGHSMGSPIGFYAASQIGDKVKLVSLWSTAKYRFPKINVPAKYVLHHGKYDVVTPIENLEFYLQNYKQQLVATFLYESEQHMLSADDFEHAVSKDIQLIREIENGNH